MEGYQRRKPPWNVYNEVVVDAEHSEQQLPGSIEAFFYPATDVCATTATCKQYVERMHAQFLDEYRVKAEDYPLLELHVEDWEHPFQIVHSVDEG